MTYEEACMWRDRGLSAYRSQIEKASPSRAAAMQSDCDALARDYDEWIAAKFPNGSAD